MSTYCHNVSLVLSGGGARGYAHIGAIEVLEERGYKICSVCGTSMGALVGGIYCTGQIETVKEWALSLTRRDILSLADWSVGNNHLIKGDKIINRLMQIVPDRPIEELPIPYRAVAADLSTCRELVFSRGSLYRAIRASISIPSFFKPITAGTHLLVDGSVSNPLPLNRIVRQKGDLLFAVDVNAPLSKEVESLQSRAIAYKQGQLSTLWSEKIMRRFTTEHPGSNYFSLLASAFAMMVMRASVQSKKITPPDLCAEMPMNRFGMFEFDRAANIIRAGREAMSAALDTWESKQDPHF